MAMGQFGFSTGSKKAGSFVNELYILEMARGLVFEQKLFQTILSGWQRRKSTARSEGLDDR
jgi:hypothetical protein